MTSFINRYSTVSQTGEVTLYFYSQIILSSSGGIKGSLNQNWRWQHLNLSCTSLPGNSKSYCNLKLCWCLNEAARIVCVPRSAELLKDVSGHHGEARAAGEKFDTFSLYTPLPNGRMALTADRPFTQNIFVSMLWEINIKKLSSVMYLFLSLHISAKPQMMKYNDLLWVHKSAKKLF